ncbi:hypothetical protein EON66_03655, partial [archaeon]
GLGTPSSWGTVPKVARFLRSPTVVHSTISMLASMTGPVSCMASNVAHSAHQPVMERAVVDRLEAGDDVGEEGTGPEDVPEKLPMLAPPCSPRAAATSVQQRGAASSTAETLRTLQPVCWGSPEVARMLQQWWFNYKARATLSRASPVAPLHEPVVSSTGWVATSPVYCWGQFNLRTRTGADEPVTLKRPTRSDGAQAAGITSVSAAGEYDVFTTLAGRTCTSGMLDESLSVPIAALASSSQVRVPWSWTPTPRMMPHLDVFSSSSCARHCLFASTAEEAVAQSPGASCDDVLHRVEPGVPVCVPYYALGSNHDGQAGDLQSSTHDTSPPAEYTRLTKLWINLVCPPHSLSQHLHVASIAASVSHSLFLLSNGALYGVGRCDAGQLGKLALGVDDVVEVRQPVCLLPLHVPEYQSAVAVRRLSMHSHEQCPRLPCPACAADVAFYAAALDYEPSQLPCSCEREYSMDAMPCEMLQPTLEAALEYWSMFDVRLCMTHRRRTCLRDHSLRERLRGDADPNAAAAPVAIVSMSTGLHHSVIVLNDGRVFACGKNDHGQTGREAMSHTRIFTRVTAGALSTRVSDWGVRRFEMQHERAAGADIAAAMHTKPRAPLLLPSAFVPVPIVQASCGLHHTLMLTYDGRVISMGRNDAGMAGIGLTTPKVFVPRAVHVGTTAATPSSISSALRASNQSGRAGTSVLLPTAARVVSVHCGGNHSLAVMGASLQERQSILVWGQNTHFQLGLQDSTDRFSPTALTIPQLGVQHTVAGRTHTWVCASVSAGMHHTSVLLASREVPRASGGPRDTPSRSTIALQAESAINSALPHRPPAITLDGLDGASAAHVWSGVMASIFQPHALSAYSPPGAELPTPNVLVLEERASAQLAMFPGVARLWIASTEPHSAHGEPDSSAQLAPAFLLTPPRRGTNLIDSASVRSKSSPRGVLGLRSHTSLLASAAAPAAPKDAAAAPLRTP